MKKLSAGLLLGFVAVLAAVVSAPATASGAHHARQSSNRGQSEQRVTICHRTGSSSNPTVTITVARSAVPAFLRQGDTLGACKTSRPAAVSPVAASTERQANDENNAAANSRNDNEQNEPAENNDSRGDVQSASARTNENDGDAESAENARDTSSDHNDR